MHFCFDLWYQLMFFYLRNFRVMKHKTVCFTFFAFQNHENKILTFFFMNQGLHVLIKWLNKDFLCYSWTRNWKRWPCNSRTLLKRLHTLNKTTTKMSTIFWAYATSLTAKVRKVDIKPHVPHLSITHSCQSVTHFSMWHSSPLLLSPREKEQFIGVLYIIHPKHVKLKCHIRCKFWLSSSAESTTDILMERQLSEHHDFVFRWREISEEPLRAETPGSVGIHGSF